MEEKPRCCKICAWCVTVKQKGGREQRYCWHPKERRGLGRPIICELIRLDGCPLDRKGGGSR